MPDARFQGFTRRLQPPSIGNIGRSDSAFFDGCPSQQEQGFGPISGVIGNHLQERLYKWRFRDRAYMRTKTLKDAHIYRDGCRRGSVG